MPKRERPAGQFRPDELVGFLEAVYRLETDEHVWLTEVMEASRRVWGRSGWVHGAIYDASDVASFCPTLQHVLDAPHPVLALLARGLQLFTPGSVAPSFRIATASLSRNLPRPELDEVYDGMTVLGYPDTLGINGVDPTGLGVFVGLWCADPGPPPAAELNVYRRMAHHLAAAHRYRRRMRDGAADGPSFDLTDGAEAVLDPRGRVVHAIGAARHPSSQAALVEASRARDLVCTATAGDHDVLRGWSPLTRARWTLVDSYERNGHRHVVARENQARISGLDALTDRERQVVAYLATGHSTKETAYALGISDTTVRVLVARAIARLGVTTRRALLEHPDVLALVPR
jgi:DNA-binding CsgD family transcriptional regulator